jgi:excisionase family DNA binding protein
MRTVSPASSKLAVSRESAADALSVDIQTIDRMIKANKLRASKLGRRVVIRVADVERLLDANAVHGDR